MDGASSASSSGSASSAAAASNAAGTGTSSPTSSSSSPSPRSPSSTSASPSTADASATSTSSPIAGPSAGRTLAGQPTTADALSSAPTALSTLTMQPTQAEVLAQGAAVAGVQAGWAPPSAWQGDANVILAQQVGGPEAVPAATEKAPPSVADQVRELTSYSLFDWSVTQQDQQRVVQLLGTDPNLNGTLRDLAGDPNFAGTTSLTAVINRVNDPAQRRDLIDVMARGSDAANADVVRKELGRLDTPVVGGPGGAAGVSVNENLFQVRFNAVRLGVPTSGPTFDRAPYADLISANPGAAFTGAGATGIDPTSAPGVPLGDQLAMAWEKWRGTDEEPGSTSARYDNPLGALDTGLSPADRARQAELFLRQPVASPMSDVWGPTPPTRAQVIEVAARTYNLDPATLAGFLLAEQRDQSQLEDAKDYAAVANANHNGSVGLGQIVISTARKDDLLADTVSPDTMRKAGNPAVARMLSDDVVSIFGAANYIRRVADAGAAIPTSVLDQRTRDMAIAQGFDPATLPANGTGMVDSLFTGFDPTQYAGNSALWSRGNLSALGSEYTSRAWDGGWSTGWGNFVAQARDDVVSSGVFR